MKNSLLLLLPLFFTAQLSAQSLTDKDYIISHTNVNALNKMAENFQEIQDRFKDVVVPEVLVDENGNEEFFSHFESNGTPVYYELGNDSSAKSSNIDEIRVGGSAGLELDGEGLNIGLWDGGNPRLSHQELAGKIAIGDAAATLGHATHVAGILVANGIEPEARGMASAATVESFTSAGWQSEIPIWAAAGGMITNHSYIIANPQEDYELYGIYNVHSQNWDALSYNAPYLIMCTGASNNGNNGFNPDGSRYDLLASNKLGKNAIVVGACEDVLNYTGPESVHQAIFTSWGPTDDWRIKPDLAAVGTNSFSSREDSDSDYTTGNGSSFAAPIVAGGLALLQQHFHDLNGVYMKAVTAKALILSTADEAGEFDGPDFSNGWGLFNARRAADVITANGITAEILELELNQDEVYTKTITADGTTPLSVAICWNDPSSTPLPNANHNDPTLMLINDLDLRVISDSLVYFPWKMEPNSEFNNYTAPAERGDNYRDNTEIIFEENIPAGEYTIEISHKNGLQTGSQPYSIVINGIEAGVSNVQQFEDGENAATFFPNPVDDVLKIDLVNPQYVVVTVLSLVGQQLLEQTFENQETVQFDVSKLPAGAYIIQIHNSEMQLIGVKKIVKD